MNKSRLRGFLVVAVVLTVAAIAVLYFFKRPQESVTENNQPFEMSGPFVGPGNANASADALSLSRVLRGYYDSASTGENSTLFLSTQINWPEETPQQLQSVQLLPQTEYLCWPSSFTTADGTVAPIKDTIYLLDYAHKLLIPGQKPLTFEEAISVLQPGKPIIVALQEPYAPSGFNTAFQIAIVGCQ